MADFFDDLIDNPLALIILTIFWMLSFSFGLIWLDNKLNPPTYKVVIADDACYTPYYVNNKKTTSDLEICFNEKDSYTCTTLTPPYKVKHYDNHDLAAKNLDLNQCIGYVKSEFSEPQPEFSFCELSKKFGMFPFINILRNLFC